VAAVALAPSGCASGRSLSGGEWMAGMMGVMIVGGVLVGGGMMHGMRHQPADTAVADLVRFSPSRLLELRELLELDAEQVAALESLRDRVAAGERSGTDAARAAYDLLRPVQRAAASGREPARNTRPMHSDEARSPGSR
jgi:hypothetical protein